MLKRMLAAAVVVAVSGTCCLAQSAAELKEKAKQVEAEGKKAGQEALKAAEKKAQEAMGQPADMGNMSPEQMMEAYAKAAAPGAEHKDMAKMAGSWTTTVTAWMAPGAPPMTSTGTSENKVMFDGRYVQQKYSGEFMGRKFEGLGFTGFNKATGKYESVWMDSMGGAISYSSGTKQADGSLVMTGVETDPMTKQAMNYKDVITVENEDHHTMTRFYLLPGGQEMKGMEIKYARAGAGKSEGAKNEGSKNEAGKAGGK